LSKSPYQFAILDSQDQAFHAAILLLSHDPSYQLLPIRQINTFHQSINHENYIFLLQENELIGLILWMEIDSATAKLCLQSNRSPFLSELTPHGEALFCTAFTAKKPSALLPLWRFFIKKHFHRDILIQRHFKLGKKKNQPTVLIQNGKRV
jgi:hemolysin-activating ACP:hemolysin acyltransferase